MFFQQLQQAFRHRFTEDQQSLVEKLSDFLFHLPETKVFIIDGYAGTGKTGLMSALVKVLPFYSIKTILLAPTGRAAKVLSRNSQKTASTIHKHIYYSSIDANGNISLKLKNNKNTSTLYIVDEASMIGAREQGFEAHNLLDDLLRHCLSGYGNKIIFMGDTAQLPPIGSSTSPALNQEYIETEFILNAQYQRLTQVVRQALQSGILRNASNIRWAIANGRIRLPILKTKDLNDVRIVESYDLEDTLRSEYREKGVNEVLIITRTNKLANRINQYVRTAILEKENQIDIGETIMSVKNNYFWTEKAALSD
ncbi:MAG: AAA family ATPase, partial [Bacteroidales bacterium]|nr:AAA family ATPase [Bacteroidales bacterium]